LGNDDEACCDVKESKDATQHTETQRQAFCLSSVAVVQKCLKNRELIDSESINDDVSCVNIVTWIKSQQHQYHASSKLTCIP